MKKRTAIYLPTNVAGRSEIEAGFNWLLQLVKSDPKKKSALLAVPVLDNLNHDIATLLGEKQVKALAEGKPITINSSLELSLLTERKQIYSWPGPVLAIFPSKKLLDAIDELPDVTDILVIPWVMEKVQYWIDTWNAMPLGGQNPPPIRFNLNPVVQAALDSLTHRVNLSTGVSHPSDKAATVRMFEILRQNGFQYDPKEVRVWLISHGGWKSTDADEVQTIADRVLQGRQFRVERGGWNEKILDIWKEDAKKNWGGT